MYVQPGQKIHFRTTAIRLSYISLVQRYFCSIASWEKIPFTMCVQQLQNQTAQQMKLEFIFHFIHIHEADAGDTQAELSLPSRP